MKINIFAAVIFSFSILTLACSAQTPEEVTLTNLRELTAGGKLPAESIVASIESRYAGKQTGALAKLLRGRIRFENKDFAGAATLLDSPDIARLTKLGDYALWLRGQALQSAGDNAAAMATFEKLENEYPDSLHFVAAKIAWANSAMNTGKAAQIPAALQNLNNANNGESLLQTAKAYESSGDSLNSIKYYRLAYFMDAGSKSAEEAGAKLTSLSQPLSPSNGGEARARAENLFSASKWSDAAAAFADLQLNYPTAMTPQLGVNRIIAIANAKKMFDAPTAFLAIPQNSAEKVDAYYQLVKGYAQNRMWPNARQYAEEMRQKYPRSPLTPKAWVDAGIAARDAKMRSEESYFMQTALINFPNATEVGSAQFELAWIQHESGNHARSSEMLIEHLAKYADKDTTNRGKAGYWAARDSEKAGKLDEACSLYDAVVYRYGANWYGHIGFERLTSLRAAGKCQTTPKFAANSLVPQAAANLKSVTVAPETSTIKALDRAEKSEELSTIGLFDWAMKELREAKKSADNSPKINLALAKHYKLKGDNVNALLALAKSYPDYAQMFPEEMSKEEWDIFYPLTNWDQIKLWGKQRQLDPYLIAGLIRQESVFNPRARSHANAYGLMQLLLPTARQVARKYGSASTISSANSLYDPALNIELGTGYMKDQLVKFGRIEYMAVAYNAGPGRVPQWRATLPLEMDEFVEEIPFKETKGYVQGVTRNSAQYRRLYDDNGNFKPAVGSRPVRADIDSRTTDQVAADLPEIRLDKTPNLAAE